MAGLDSGTRHIDAIGAGRPTALAAFSQFAEDFARPHGIGLEDFGHRDAQRNGGGHRNRVRGGRLFCGARRKILADQSLCCG